MRMTAGRGSGPSIAAPGGAAQGASVDASGPGAPPPSRGFRRLALATGVATFLLIVLGGVVRVSGSGLGCGPAGSGFHGWPLCEGDLLPGLDLNSVIEYAHRVVAVAVGLMMLWLAVWAWRRYRARHGIVLAATAAVVLVGAQGLLGAATVEEGLDEGLVAAHLGLAMILLGLLVYVWRASRPGVPGAPPASGGPAFRPLAAAGQGVLFLTIVAGGYMAGTQNYGRADYQLGDGAHHACGREFPTCNGDFLPFGVGRLIDIHLTHRVLMYLATALIVALIVVAVRRAPGTPLARMAWVTGGLLAAQVAVGALNVWLEEYELLILAHLTLASLLWGQLLALNLSLYPVGAPARAGERTAGRAAARTEAVTA
jgi:heme A synthase